MDSTYKPHEIERDAQEFWEKKQSFKASEDLHKKKFYCLSMFPYPSGQLHMGHVRNYTIGDVVTRYQHMQGKSVLQPIGWDAFGLPAENAAIKHNLPPAKWTYSNIAAMRNQLQQLGFGYDWDREITTCDPSYYRWEQWFFTRLFHKGLVYRKSSIVNWDPVDQTVLANEQVVDGRGWRSGALIERREIPQWFLKITAYADELLADLDKLDQWPEQVRTMQRNWIGRSEGTEIIFEVLQQNTQLKIFTTRPDTLMGATYVAIAAEHPLAHAAAKQNKDVQTFITQCQNLKTAEADIATQEKKGIDTGFKAIHPITGELLPIWIANFVLMEYGSGAVMAVPAHDQRDFEFAKQYHLAIKQVIKPKSTEQNSTCDLTKAAFTESGVLINSAEFNNLDSATACKKITDHLIQKGCGERKINYRIRDWGISRQRYWGTPIPMIYCCDCGAVPVPEQDLPVVLPENVEFSGTSSPLKSMPEFHETTCPKCKRAARRETDTFDTFVESSWYYARYACVNQDNAMLDDRAKYWTPVDFYIGGIEHAVMHLLYARFFHKLLRDEGLVNSDEPFTKLLTQGMVLKDGAKMSKSKGNTVDPQAMIDKYGADTVRLFIMFAAPPEQSLEWSDSGVEGAYRFLKRLWSLGTQHTEIIKATNADLKNNLQGLDYWQDATQDEQKFRQQIYTILRQALFDFERSQFNTVVSAAMKLVNLLNEIPSNTIIAQRLIHEGFSIVLRLLSPIVPHITHHLWRELEYGQQILHAEWPTIDEQALQIETITLILQINGKVRGQLETPADADQKQIEELVLKNPSVEKYLTGKTPKKIIVVPGRLVNVVVE